MSISGTNLNLSVIIQALGSFSLQELTELEQRVHKEVEVKSIKPIYGSGFTEIVGAHQIYPLKGVSAKSLGLDTDVEYPKIGFSKLPEDHQAVRGILNDDRPFIAVNIEMLDEAHKVIDVVTELIFKRYSRGSGSEPGQPYENNYVATASIISKEGKIYSSCLYNSGGMSRKQIEAVRDLLAGQTIPAPHNPTATNPLYIRMKKV